MDLLNKLNQFSEHRIDIFAVGGTALTLLDMKDSTRDVDFNIDSREGYEEIKKLFKNMDFNPIEENKWMTDIGFRIDLFEQGYIFCTQLLEDYQKKSKKIKDFGNIRLFAISPYDIIITKIARMDERDLEDIKTIFKKDKIDIKKLSERFIKTMDNSFISNANDNMLLLLKKKLAEWEIDTSEEAIKMVEKWQMRQ